MADTQDVTQTITHAPTEPMKAAVQAMAVARAVVSASMRNYAVDAGPKLSRQSLKQPTFDLSLINMQNSGTSNYCNVPCCGLFSTYYQWIKTDTQ